MGHCEGAVRTDNVEKTPILTLYQKDYGLAGVEPLNAHNPRVAHALGSEYAPQHIAGGVETHAARDVHRDALFAQIDGDIRGATPSFDGHFFKECQRSSRRHS